MKQTTIERLAKENLFETVGKEWMLITAGTPENFNMMTASWGGFGWLWNKPVAFIFVRPERFTFPLIEQNDLVLLWSRPRHAKNAFLLWFCLRT